MSIAWRESTKSLVITRRQTYTSAVFKNSTTTLQNELRRKSLPTDVQAVGESGLLLQISAEHCLRALLASINTIQRDGHIKQSFGQIDSRQISAVSCDRLLDQLDVL